MKKTYMVSILVFIVVISALFIASCSSPPKDVQSADVSKDIVKDDNNLATDTTKDKIITKPIIISESLFEFEGYAVGKSHIGKFDTMSGEVDLDKDGNVVGMRLKIDPATVNTGIAGLDKDLKSDNFYDVAKYPEINVDSVKIADGKAIVNLDFRGITREVTFDVKQGENSISTEFMLDTTPFNMKYIAVNKEVRIKFDLKY